jgi:N-acetylmuramoyl-L-alanine amidase CwlA
MAKLKFIYKLADHTNYGKARKLSDMKYIVIHYTGNKKDTAKGNATYFATNKHLGASAHVFVDKTGAYKSVPLRNVAWSVGKLYNKKYAKYWGKATNSNTLNIEIACDAGNYKASKETIDMAVALTKYYMKKYKIPKSHVIRHKDVCGKDCPGFWFDDAKWKKEFLARI